MYDDIRGGLDLSNHPCDYYLVLTGPARRPAQTGPAPWTITAVYLFDAIELIRNLNDRGVKIGVATSIRKADLDASQLHPITGTHCALHLTERQRTLLTLLSTAATPADPRRHAR
jgi:hypothetical protein